MADPNPAPSPPARSYRKIDPVTKWLTSVLSYGTLGRVLGRFYGSAFVQRRYCGQHAKALTPLLAVADPQVDPSAALQLLMLGMRLDEARLLAVAGGTGAQIEQWFPVSGFDIITKLREEGRRVIVLNSHFGAARIVPLWMARRGLPVHSLEGKNTAGEFGVGLPENLELSELSGAFLARSVFLMRKALEAGSIVHLTGDGGRGSRSLAIPFLGRERTFTAGFAELALVTDAVVVPVFVPHCGDGSARIEFQPPLDAGDPVDSFHQRASRLVENYAMILKERWRTDPGNVRHGQLDQFGQLPRPKVKARVSFEDAISL